MGMKLRKKMTPRCACGELAIGAGAGLHGRDRPHGRWAAIAVAAHPGSGSSGECCAVVSAAAWQCRVDCLGWADDSLPASRGSSDGARVVETGLRSPQHSGALSAGVGWETRKRPVKAAEGGTAPVALRLTAPCANSSAECSSTTSFAWNFDRYTREGLAYGHIPREPGSLAMDPAGFEVCPGRVFAQRARSQSGPCLAGFRAESA